MTESAGARPPATTESEFSSWPSWRLPPFGRPRVVGVHSPYPPPALPRDPVLSAWARELLPDVPFPPAEPTQPEPCPDWHECRWCGGRWNLTGRLWSFPGPAEYCRHTGALHTCACGARCEPVIIPPTTGEQPAPIAPRGDECNGACPRCCDG